MALFDSEYSLTINYIIAIIIVLIILSIALCAIGNISKHEVITENQLKSQEQPNEKTSEKQYKIISNSGVYWVDKTTFMQHIKRLIEKIKEMKSYYPLNGDCNMDALNKFNSYLTVKNNEFYAPQQTIARFHAFSAPSIVPLSRNDTSDEECSTEVSSDAVILLNEIFDNLSTLLKKVDSGIIKQKEITLIELDNAIPKFNHVILMETLKNNQNKKNVQTNKNTANLQLLGVKPNSNIKTSACKKSDCAALAKKSTPELVQSVKNVKPQLINEIKASKINAHEFEIMDIENVASTNNFSKRDIVKKPINSTYFQYCNEVVRDIYNE